jgi:hypothetical protein
MKKKFLQKLTIGFSLLFSFTYGILYACGGGWDYFGVFYDTNITPEVFVDKSYTPLFLSTDFFYSNNEYGFDDNYVNRFNDEIQNDWTGYLENKLNKEQVGYFLTNDSSYIDVNALNKYLTKNTKSEIVTKWKSKIDLKNKKIKKFIKFIGGSYAIQSNQDYYSWNRNNDSIKMAQSIPLDFEKLYNSETDLFLKNRYWFQTIKQLFYNQEYDNVSAFFEKTKDNMTKNTLYYRALSYCAGVEYKKKNYAKSNFLYAQVFDKCPTLRVVSAYNFHPQEEQDWQQSLKMATTNQEKTALWAIHGYYNDDKTAIEEIYKLDPKSEYINYLLSRVINGIEMDCKGSPYEQKPANFEQFKDSLIKENIVFVSKIANAKNTNTPYIWNLSAGYLHTLNKDYNAAKKYFDLAEKELPETDLAKNQLRLLRFINTVSELKKIDTKTEKQLTDDLNWLYVELPKNTTSVFRINNATEWSKKIFSDLYKKQNDVVKAELFNRNLGYYQNDDQLQKMKTFLANTNKSKFEEIAASIYPLKIENIAEFEMVRATYSNKITEAIDLLKQTNLENTEFQANPFNGFIKDCHDCEFEMPQKKKYTFIEILTLLQEMQNKIANKEDVYTNSLLLANAFYNFTHFGTGRIFYEGEIVGYGSSPYNFDDANRIMITDCSLAKMYYEKALAAAKTDEQKAKCHYMLAKCERNDFYNKKYFSITDWWSVEDDGINFIAWNGFKNLKKSYFNTKYYQEVIRECDYFDTYINGPKN